MNGFYEYVKMAVQNIRANKGRSFLTMLGIIIGIASVIAIVSIGEGTKNQMNSEISDIGGGQIYIYVSSEGMSEEVWITPEDLQEIRDLKYVEGVSVADSYNGETLTGKGTFDLMVTAEGPDAKMINNADMKYGTYFGEREVEEAKPVCVISDSDARRLFGTDDVVGMSIDITCYDVTKSFRIVGVTTQKENGTFVSYTYEGMPVNVNIPDVVGMSIDITCYDVTKSFRIVGVTTQKENGTFVSYTYEGMPVNVNIPYSSMNELVGDVGYFYSVTIQSDTSRDSQKTANEIIHVLEKRHQCAGDEYFQVQNFQDVMKSMNQMLGMVTAFISFVAGIDEVHEPDAGNGNSIYFLCCRYFSACRRYRCYEYHAGVCDGTYQGDRYS